MELDFDGSSPHEARAETAAGDEMACRSMPSPIGALLVVASRRGLRSIIFPDSPRPSGVVHDPRARSVEIGGPAEKNLDQALSQLEEYFAGGRRRCELDLDAVGTPFQTEVWDALAGVEFGTTVTYGDIARRIGRPRAFRAVGQANNRNPIPIVVPCHRVVGADGSLTGYGGGLAVKDLLLAFEGTSR